MSYQRVLVPLDSSRLAERALPYAKAVALNTGSELILFTVIPDSSEKLDRPMKAYMDINAKTLMSQGMKVNTAIACGSAADEIIKFADKNKVDLIIISTHGHSGIRRWMLGSIALKLLHGTCVPVLLVKSRADKTSKVEFQKILVPLDGSSFSEASIPHVKKLTEGSSGEVILLRVSEPPAIPADRPPTIKPSWEEYRNILMAEIQQQSLEYLQKVKVELEKSGATVSTQAILGEAIKGILQVAQKENVNLIAMTSHGRTGISRWVYGSVTTRIVEESLQPVLLIRPTTPK